MPREFDVIIEKDEDGFFVATVPALPGCHVPVHGKEPIGPGLLGKILHDCRLTREDLARNL